ncbi:MAG TPA: PocR ligand-binding domain-containing protein [Patescibacteria group bacterium]|nr:PocR ligand-binding domain-containing protein [Patescibacteria group bacterium]
MRFSELVDIEELQTLCDSYHAHTGAVMAILDLEGNILISTGWQDICTRFHRAHPQTALRCRESDTILADQLGQGQHYNVYRCKNGLIDVAVPIFIGGQHVANFFTGQFFFVKPDRDVFVRQAQEFGFDTAAYLAALDKVPIVTEEYVQKVLYFFSRLSHLFGEMGLARKNLKEKNDELEFKVEVRTQELVAANQELVAMNQEMTLINDSLQNANRKLEGEIVERSRVEVELEKSNAELISTLDQLRKTQAQLIQSEKMAALGSLVAGVAHEINTPLGNSVTVASHLHSLVSNLSGLYSRGQMKAAKLEEFIRDDEESLHLLELNLKRAAELVRSFKNVASTQMQEERQRFNVRHFLEEVLLTLHPHLKKTQLQFVLDCPDDLVWHGYSGILAQLATNFTMNSLAHAYDPGQAGTLTLAVNTSAKHLLVKYTDDGKGMPEEICNRVFEPFFTTTRGSGGTGLGLYVVYNLVTQRLNGSIECLSAPGQGTTFRVELPLQDL